MQKWLSRYRNWLTAITGVLIILAFSSKWFFSSEQGSAYLLFVASLVGGLPIFVQAYQALRIKVISIDFLVTLAILGAFVIKEFEESAIVAFLFLFGAYLEQRTLAKTRSAIKNLVEMVPETTFRKLHNGDFEEVSVEEVNEEDILLVKTGGKIPVDGEVIFGSGTANEASITGESIPVSKGLRDKVFAGTILENGTIQIRTEKIGEDTTFGKIIELVEEAQDSKSKAERFIDQFSKYYTPSVLVLAIIVWLISRNIELAVTILVLGCPGALVIGVPVSNVSGIGNGARHGILFKGSDVVLVGNSYLMNQYNIPFTNQMKSDIAGMEAEGNSIVLTAIDGQIALVVGIRDQIRQGVKEDLETLKNMGVKNLILLSGDNQGTVDLVTNQLGLTEAYGHLLPEDKAEFVRKRQASGEIVAFVGDGINDSPSLALADIGIAMGNGTDIAIETSNVVLMNSDFHRIPHAIGLAKATRRNMIENIFIALLVVVVLLISVLSSSWMNMAIGMFVHEGSILVVILNAMRLLKYKRK